MKEKLRDYKIELENELRKILSWWMQMAVDKEHGGFVGKIDHDNQVCPEAAKGSVLNSRILWAFSSAYNLTKDREYLKIAERAFHYIAEHFIDKECGGVYWSVDFAGKPLDSKKQIYALAFSVYGLSEFYLASKNENAKKIAVYIYNDILTHSYDEKYGGYIEALTRDWKPAADLRLSEKDANEKKSMNTHLHLLEAFVNLYRIWKDNSLKQRIVEIIRIFLNHIVDNKTGHLILFFDETWNRQAANIISYGHDIEASWLIEEAAGIIEDDILADEVKTRSVQIALAAAKGLDGDGGLWYEYDASQQHLTREKHSWPQAEAMVGFFNAWQVTGDEKFLKRSLQAWEFVKEYMLDKKLGEWYWGVNADHSAMKQEKAGTWKCPYHNGRACMEIIRRIDNIFKENK